ncbi:enolase C-terminal domain-like protein [Streptomyces yaizuensis]|uniref:glucarate dehydratase n=1 Tax=Streptomyces yaizuensis TaxID=2989713 RepID=A0ABQ5NTS8_9ACTN|nr:enolase C-terminal domain-like protein [Streptomyces sp. YSPA8]GLF93776.1 glucarate dehydratase family protein [Streptomyces sp. YSPA8]
MPQDPTIDTVRLTPVLIADPPLLNTQGVHQPYTPRLIVEVVTEDGVSGVGETYGDARYLGAAASLAAALPGRRVTDLNGLHRLAALLPLAEPNGPDDHPGTPKGPAAGPAVSPAAGPAVSPAAGLRGASTPGKLRRSVVSAFEVALLDALGRTTGLPVHALLGGKVRDTVEYSGYLFYRWAAHPGGSGEPDDWGAALDPAGIVAQARRLADRYGFASFKLKGGVLPPDEEIAAVRALADAFPGAPLRLDPNGAWSVATSLRVVRELADVLEYLEDPAATVGEMAEVAAGTPLPLATNMCVTAFEEIPEAFARGAVRVVLCDHHYWGGLRATGELAAICRTYGVALSMHSNTHLGISLAAMTHAAAVLPGLQHACDTHYPWQTEDVLTERPVFRDGRLAVGDRPGLGVELDRGRLAALHRRWLDDDGRHRDRDDVAAMRVHDPDWVTPAVPRW